MTKNLSEELLSAKAGREGKDLGKPGKNFDKIADKAGKEYGSSEAGKKVAGAILAKIRAKHGVKEEAGSLDAQIDTSLSDIKPGKTGEIYNKTKEATTGPSPVTGTSTGISAGKDGEVLSKPLTEAKKSSPIAGTRLISRHAGENGHHAEVRYSPEWQEHSVHHYYNGEHLGEGPVSYHGEGKDGRADATETAEYAIKNFHVKSGKLLAKSIKKPSKMAEAVAQVSSKLKEDLTVKSVKNHEIDLKDPKNDEVKELKAGKTVKTNFRMEGANCNLHMKSPLKGRSGEYEHKAVSTRDKKLEETISTVLDKSVNFTQMFNESLDAVLRGEVSPEQRNDWIHVESGRMPFMDYLNKYRV